MKLFGVFSGQCTRCKPVSILVNKTNQKTLFLVFCPLEKLLTIHIQEILPVKLLCISYQYFKLNHVNSSELGPPVSWASSSWDTRCEKLTHGNTSFNQHFIFLCCSLHFSGCSYMLWALIMVSLKSFCLLREQKVIVGLWVLVIYNMQVLKAKPN